MNTIFINKSNIELWNALNGFPYFVVVQDTINSKGGAAGRVTKDFDFDNLFEMIIYVADHNPKLREKLADYVIELSKHV